MLQNLTPHEIVIYNDADEIVARIPPDPNGPARVLIATSGGWTSNKIPVVRTIPGEVTGLPGPYPGMWRIVSSLVAAAALISPRGALDLLTPHDPVRDGAGQPIGCRALALVGPHDRPGRGHCAYCDPPNVAWRDR